MNVSNSITNIDTTRSDRLRNKYLKELFDYLFESECKEVNIDVDRIASWYHAHPSVRKWIDHGRCKYVRIDRIKELLGDCEVAKGRKNKAKIAIEMYKYNIDNFWWITQIDKKYHKTCDAKALEMLEETDFPDLIELVQEWLDKYSYDVTRCDVCETHRLEGLVKVGACPYSVLGEGKCCLYLECESSTCIFHCCRCKKISNNELLFNKLSAEFGEDELVCNDCIGEGEVKTCGIKRPWSGMSLQKFQERYC